jgi:hypothetical protein
MEVKAYVLEELIIVISVLFSLIFNSLYFLKACLSLYGSMQIRQPR